MEKGSRQVKDRFQLIDELYKVRQEKHRIQIAVIRKDKTIESQKKKIKKLKEQIKKLKNGKAKK